MTAFWKLGKRKGRGTSPPGGIDCSDVVAQLYEFIDGELEDAETVAKIRGHLDLCKRCYPHYDFEKAFLRFLAEQGRTCAPPELKRRIFERILEEESRD